MREEMHDVEALAKQRFGDNFVLRKGQLEIIEDIIKTFKEGQTKLYLLDACTGSGKSVIAMLVADVLNEDRKRGYILASDLSLVEQYKRDFDLYFPHFGVVKGNDNYKCSINDEKFSLGECRMKNMTYESMETLGCYGSCGYLQARKKAMAAPTSLTTYAFWLVQRNYVERKMEERQQDVPFGMRDFTIFDEAHKATEIVQSHFAPRVDNHTLEKLERCRQFMKKHGLPTPSVSESHLASLVQRLYRNEGEELVAALVEFEGVLAMFLGAGGAIKERVGQLFPGVMKVSAEWRFAMNLVDHIKDLHCKFEDYNVIVACTGVGAMIKNPQKDGVVFNCLDESYMMDKHFHSQADFKLLMTATMGNPSRFLKTIGGKSARYQHMDSNFNFTKSPVYFYSGKRMSMKTRDQNLPWMSEKVSEILAKHPEDSGIIHSGSYDMTAKIFNGLTPEAQERVLVYHGTAEKEMVLEKFLTEKNLVIIGPSILEGLDLHEDKSRFQIFAKVPYPSLGDKFVAAKMNAQHGWYEWKTSLAILQGVGRSVRSDKDWAITYFLDGCFGDLLRDADLFPEEFRKRVVRV